MLIFFICILFARVGNVFYFGDGNTIWNKFYADVLKCIKLSITSALKSYLSKMLKNCYILISLSQGYQQNDIQFPHYQQHVKIKK